MNHDAREEDMPSSSSHEPIERRAAMEQPGAAAKASRGERSVFPIAVFLHVQPRKLEFLDLSSREEIEFVELWRIAMRPLLDSTGLLGFPMDAQMVLHAMIDLQRQVMARVDGLVNSQKPSGVIDKPEAALRSLLRGGTPYDMSTPNENLAPYRYELVSIPQDITGCPDLQDVLLPHDRHFLEAGKRADVEAGDRGGGDQFSGVLGSSLEAQPSCLPQAGEAVASNRLLCIHYPAQVRDWSFLCLEVVQDQVEDDNRRSPSQQTFQRSSGSQSDDRRGPGENRSGL